MYFCHSNNGLRRREFSQRLASASALAVIGGSLAACSDNQPIDSADDVAVEFTHGVASGDPLADRVILWTRAVPELPGPVSVVWEVATNKRFATLVSSGLAHTDAGRDYTIKVDAHGLALGTRYFYRFRAPESVSPVGVTRTLPGVGAEHVRLAVVSCAKYTAGFFHAYREIAEREFDAVLHLGDYLYEFAPGIYADSDAARLGRVVTPPGELLTLEDYRLRYAQYRSDLDLQAAHGGAPVYRNLGRSRTGQ